MGRAWGGKERRWDGKRGGGVKKTGEGRKREGRVGKREEGMKRDVSNNWGNLIKTIFDTPSPPFLMHKKLPLRCVA